MNNRSYKICLDTLKKELVPALGCTEPISIAYAAAKAKQVLEKKPEHIEVECSGNIVKNVMGVIVPNSGNEKGIAIAATLGAIAGNAEDGLKVLENITQEEINYCKRIVSEQFCECKLAKGVNNLYVSVKAISGDNYSKVTVSETHMNVIEIVKNGEILFQLGSIKREEDFSIVEMLSISEIIEFANTVGVNEISKILDTQIECNMKIADEGLKNDYGANVGKVLLNYGKCSFNTRVKAKVAAASDARMSGCNLPVVINSGSGNQGLTVSLPVIEYASENSIDRETLYRALVVSNLVSIYGKKHIGSLSAFCGAVTAAAGAGAGITYLMGWNLHRIGKVIEGTLANAGGMICDGAKSTCAAKLTTALDAALLAIDIVDSGNCFGNSEGVIGKNLEETIANVGYIGKNGMAETDENILGIMIGDIITINKSNDCCMQK